MRIAPTPAATRLLAHEQPPRRTHGGRTGSAARRSTRTKTASSATPATRTPMPGSEAPRPRLAALEQAQDEQASPTVSSAGAGVVDAGLAAFDLSWKLRPSMAAASRHSGMLTRKIQRQLRYSENTPPRVGPTTDETAHTLAM